MVLIGNQCLYKTFSLFANSLPKLRKHIASLPKKYNVELQLIINKRFYECFREMRAYAKKESKEIKHPFMRLFQVEECLGSTFK